MVPVTYVEDVVEYEPYVHESVHEREVPKVITETVEEAVPSWKMKDITVDEMVDVDVPQTISVGYRVDKPVQINVLEDREKTVMVCEEERVQVEHKVRVPEVVVEKFNKIPCHWHSYTHKHKKNEDRIHKHSDDVARFHPQSDRDPVVNPRALDMSDPSIFRALNEEESP